MIYTKPIIILSLIAFLFCSCRKEFTCFDGKQNQGELSIDCGGPCALSCGPVASCNDGLLNQGEIEIDCGGPCISCEEKETCEDGIQNQDETAIDCGGICAPCHQCNAPSIENGRLTYTVYNTLIESEEVTATLDSYNLFTLSGVFPAQEYKIMFYIADLTGTDNFNAQNEARVIFFIDEMIAYDSSNSASTNGQIVINYFKNEPDCKQIAGYFNFSIPDSNDSLLPFTNGLFDVTF